MLTMLQHFISLFQKKKKKRKNTTEIKVYPPYDFVEQQYFMHQFTHTHNYRRPHLKPTPKQRIFTPTIWYSKTENEFMYIL